MNELATTRVPLGPAKALRKRKIVNCRGKAFHLGGQVIAAKREAPRSLTRSLPAFGCNLGEIAPNRPDMVAHLASGRHTTVSMTNPADRVEIITSVQRRRRWTGSEKVRMVEETFEPGMTVSLVARRHGVAPNPVLYVAPAGGPGGADGRRQRRRG